MAYAWKKAGDYGGGFGNSCVLDPRQAGGGAVFGDVWGVYGSVVDGVWQGRMKGLSGGVKTSGGTPNIYGRCVQAASAKYPGRFYVGSGNLQQGLGGGFFGYIGSSVSTAMHTSTATQYGYGTSLGTGMGAFRPRSTGQLIVVDYDGSTEYIYTCFSRSGASVVARSTNGGDTWVELWTGTIRGGAFSGMELLDLNSDGTKDAILFSTWRDNTTDKTTKSGSVVRLLVGNGATIRTATGTGQITASTVGAAPAVVEDIRDVSAAQDASLIWAACGPYGVYTINRSNGTAWTRQDGTKFNNLWCSSIDGNGSSNVWLALAQAGNSTEPAANCVYKWNGSTWTSMTSGTITYGTSGGKTLSVPWGVLEDWWLLNKASNRVFQLYIGGPKIDLQQISVSRQDPNVVLCCGGGGAHMTQDGGTSWRPAAVGLNGSEWDGVDATSTTNMQASGGDWDGYLSTNHGKSGRELSPPPSISGKGQPNRTDGSGNTYAFSNPANPVITKNGTDITDDYFKSMLIQFEGWDVSPDGYVYIAQFGGGVIVGDPTGTPGPEAGTGGGGGGGGGGGSTGTGVGRLLDMQAPIGTATTIVLTIPSGGVSVGNTIIVGGGSNHVNVTGIVDTGGNTYTNDALVNGTTATHLSVWSAPVTTALAAGDLITLTYTGTVSGRVAIAAAYSGLLTSSANDSPATGTGSDSTFTLRTATATGAAATAQNNETIISFIVLGGSGNSAGTVTKDPTYGLLGEIETASGTQRVIGMQDQSVVTVRTPQATWSWGAATGYAEAVVAYKQSTIPTTNFPTIPPTDDGKLHRWSYANVYVKAISDPDTTPHAQQMGRDYDLIMENPGKMSPANAQQMISVNSDLVMVLYEKGVVTTLGASAFPNAWYAHQTANPTVKCLMPNGDNLMHADATTAAVTVGGVTATNWKTYNARQSLAELAAENAGASTPPWSGLYLDSLGPFCWQHDPLNPATNASYGSAQAWCQQVEWHSADVAIGATENPNAYWIFANGLTPTASWTWQLATSGHSHGAVSEGNFVGLGDPVTKVITDAYFQSAASMALTVQTAGQWVFALDYLADWTFDKTSTGAALPAATIAANYDRWRQWCFAYTMLFNRGKLLGCVVLGTSNTDGSGAAASIAPWLETAQNPSLYALNFGAPLMSPSSVGGHGVPGQAGLYFRTYTTGLVLLNTQGTAARTYTADRAYQTLDGATTYAQGQVISVPAQRALFLNLGSVSGSIPTNINQPTVTTSNTTGGAFVGDVLTLAVGEDPVADWTGNPSSFAQQWQRVNATTGAITNIGAATGTSYTLVSGDLGFKIRLRIFAMNTFGQSAAAFTTPTSVVTTAPAGLPAPVAPLPYVGDLHNNNMAGVSPTVGDVVILVASASNWTNPPVTLTQQWQRDTADITVGSTPQNTAYGIQTADAGHTLRVVVTAHNASGTATYTTASTGVVQPLVTAPTNTSPPTISASQWEEGFVVTANDGQWTGSPTLTRTWRRVLADGSNIAIPGATGTTYTLTTADVGLKVRVRVSATNTAGSLVVSSAISPIVQAAPNNPPTPPANTSPPIVSSIAFQVGTPSSTTNGVWTDATDPFTYEWLRTNPATGDFTVIAGAVGSAYTPVTADVGSQLQSRVTAHNVVGATSATSGLTPVIAAVGTGGGGGSTGGGSTGSGEGTVTIDGDLVRIELRLDQRGLQ